VRAWACSSRAWLVALGAFLLLCWGLECVLERAGYGVPIEQVRLGKLLMGGNTEGLVVFDRRLVFKLNSNWRLHPQHAGPQALGDWPWRGRPALPAPADMQRIVCLGDSNMYGYGLRVRETLPEQLGARLAERGFDPRGWQCLMFAVPSWSSVQVHNGLDDALALGNVRGVVLWSTVYNDLTYAIGRRDVEIDRVNERPTLIERCTESAIGDALGRLLDPQAHAPLDMAPIAAGWESGHPLYGTRLSAEESCVELRGMLATAAAHGARVIVISPPYSSSVLERTPGIASLRERLAAEARAAGAQVVDADAVFEATGLGRRHLWLDELHPSTLGHAALATEVANLLQAELGAPSTPASAPGRPRLSIERVEPTRASALGDEQVRIELAGWSRGDPLPVVTVAGAPLLDLEAVGAHELAGTLIENGLGPADVIVQGVSGCAVAPAALLLRGPEWSAVEQAGASVRFLGRAGDRYQVFAALTPLAAPLWTEVGAIWIDPASVLGRPIEGAFDAEGVAVLDLRAFTDAARARGAQHYVLQGRCIPRGISGDASMFLSGLLEVEVAR
jgi:hypothetical protein